MKCLVVCLQQFQERLLVKIFNLKKMKNFLSKINLALRGIMEFGIIVSTGYWGFQTGHTTITKIILCIASPLIVFGFWGTVDFRNFGPISEHLRLIQELLLSGLAIAALYFAGLPSLALVLGIISVLHHILVYFLGERLLKQQ